MPNSGSGEPDDPGNSTPEGIPKKAGFPKAKAGAQAKGITEDSGPSGQF